jgi:RNA polymerase sigma-B factor
MTGAHTLAVADRAQLIERHLPLARSLARRYMQGGEPLDDLEQTARVGLIKAADRYDPARGEFAAYAVPTMLGELRRHFRDRGWAVRVPRRIQDRTLAVERASTILSAELHRSPTAAEVAKHTGLSVEEVLEADEAQGAHWTVALVTGPGDEEHGSRDPGGVDDGYARAEEHADVMTMLRALEPRDREIVLLRFHQELSQREIGLRLGISQMGVSRILRRSLECMRLAAEG